MDGLIVLGVLILAAGAIGGSLAYGLSRSVPTPENRPMPLERTADVERARDEALKKLAARARAQDQRAR
jgi:hypothetical protein